MVKALVVADRVPEAPVGTATTLISHLVAVKVVLVHLAVVLEMVQEQEAGKCHHPHLVPEVHQNLHPVAGHRHHLAVAEVQSILQVMYFIPNVALDAACKKDMQI